ncbi:PEGA domain-containing protein [Candidatus Uhrbacteria bacterium]|nr:PEGA domain-containing protein [Candidatus Uhrbacteria bacterium]
MPKIPFHRRIFPLIIIIIFFVVAPILLFYTAGYRWNPKKGQVERNGTVIFDSTPTGADISIDGRSIGQKTPITIQDVTPGLHSFSLSKDGYYGWEKSLDVYPEKVTFINGIWLWKKAGSALLYPSDAVYQALSPDGSKLLLASASPTQTVIYGLNGAIVTSLAFAEEYKPTNDLIWSDNSRYILSGDSGNDSQNWIIDAYGTNAPMKLLPGDYRWSGTDLVGNDGKTQSVLHTSDYSLARNPLTENLVDSIPTAEIRHASGTNDLVYVSLDQPKRGLVLPEGDWRIDSVSKDRAILRDDHRWLSLDFNKTVPEYHSADSDRLRPITIKKQTSYLLINGTELSVWDPSSEPELIQRQSEKIVDAAWHREGTDIFFATEHAVFALGLDARDRRLITQLDTFDQVRGLAVDGQRLLILGDKGSESGVWSLDVE